MTVIHGFERSKKGRPGNLFLPCDGNSISIASGRFINTRLLPVEDSKPRVSSPVVSVAEFSSQKCTFSVVLIIYKVWTFIRSVPMQLPNAMFQIALNVHD